MICIFRRIAPAVALALSLTCVEAADQLDSIRALDAATRFALSKGKDVKAMDAKITFYRPAHKPPSELVERAQNAASPFQGKSYWRVLFYVDIAKSPGLRGRSHCVYVDATSGGIIDTMEDCPI